MKVSELQEKFIGELKELLPDWRFVKSDRHFKIKRDDVVWFLHISCINHESYFDAVANVAVEFVSGKERVCIIGAELGNIEGSGQRRFPVSSPTEAIRSSMSLYDLFVKVGQPFLQKFSNPNEVVSTLKRGGKEAMLISPLMNQHESQINRLCKEYGIGM